MPSGTTHPNRFDPLDRVLPIEHVGDIDSTMSLAKEAVESGNLRERGADSGVMYVARSQSTGRGRFAREWYSPPGGLWTTIAWPIGAGDGGLQSFIKGLALRVGVACLLTVRNTLSHHGHGPRINLKWPNDILINEKKVCGNICQIIQQAGRAYLLIGVGMNANNNPAELPEDLRRPATSLSNEIKQPVDMTRLERELRANLHHAATTRGADDQTIAVARQALHGIGRTIEIHLPTGDFKRGTLKGLSEDGRLELDCHGTTFIAPLGSDLA
ncbi:MAG: biotin--[acetyl-CoA-carboxylase] ligase [Phycisphaeraceae bacterium]|nr:biotin--[acetyl-CoA-carboxylase] ligase [Phycisphaerales bacterium]MCB9842163.1 biotin--[acetyl-CoA-carboxylase] ligase [Phycisphaeraceae bacterium]